MEYLIPAAIVFASIMIAALTAKSTETVIEKNHDRMTYDPSTDRYTVPATTNQSGHW